MKHMRLFELARMLNMSNKNLIEEIKALNIEAKSYLSMLNSETIDTIMANIKKKDSEPTSERNGIRRRRRNDRCFCTLPTNSGS